MNKQRSYAGVFSLVLLLLLVLSATQAAPQAANFVGTWRFTMEGGGNRGGGGGNGGGGNGGGRAAGAVAERSLNHTGQREIQSHAQDAAQRRCV